MRKKIEKEKATVGIKLVVLTKTSSKRIRGLPTKFLFSVVAVLKVIYRPHVGTFTPA